MTVSEYKKQLRKAITDSIEERWMLLAKNPKREDVPECQLCVLHRSLSYLNTCKLCPFPWCFRLGLLWDRFNDAPSNEARGIALEIIETLRAIDVDKHAVLLLKAGVLTKGGKQ